METNWGGAMRRSFTTLAIYAVALSLAALALALTCGCAHVGVDNSAGGGGRFSIDTFHPCHPVQVLPVGGNVGQAGNATSDGGSVGTRLP